MKKLGKPCLRCGGRAKRFKPASNDLLMSHGYCCKKCGFGWCWDFGKYGLEIGWYGGSDWAFSVPQGGGMLLVVSWIEIK